MGVLLLRQFRPSLRKYIYELPAGTIDPGEGLITTVKRELIEETGYRSTTITRLGKIYPVPGYSTEIIYSKVDKIYDFEEKLKELKLKEYDSQKNIKSLITKK